MRQEAIDVAYLATAVAELEKSGCANVHRGALRALGRIAVAYGVSADEVKLAAFDIASGLIANGARS